MALNKEITLENGIITNYHRISEVFLSSNDVKVPINGQIEFIDGVLQDSSYKIIQKLLL